MHRIMVAIAAVVVIVAAGVFYFYSQSLPAFWTLNAGASTVTFSSVKNGDIGETHFIRHLEGEADFNGTFKVMLDLKSVDTGIETRDERMREFLFETDSYPVATVAGSFSITDFEGLTDGAAAHAVIPATLKLHGVERPLEIPVVVTRMGWDRVSVASEQPVLVVAADYGLEGGIEKLRELAGLDSISEVVPVTFFLVFEGGIAPAGRDN